eukprot:scaffold7679_cov403-Prasinococcus_capsulatus_cf.AAC.8
MVRRPSCRLTGASYSGSVLEGACVRGALVLPTACMWHRRRAHTVEDAPIHGHQPGASSIKRARA